MGGVSEYYNSSFFFTKSDKFSEVFMNVFSEIALGDLQGHLMLPSQEEG